MHFVAYVCLSVHLSICQTWAEDSLIILEDEDEDSLTHEDEDEDEDNHSEMKPMRTRTARGPRNCCPRSLRTRTRG